MRLTFLNYENIIFLNSLTLPTGLSLSLVVWFCLFILFFSLGVFSSGRRFWSDVVFYESSWNSGANRKHFEIEKIQLIWTNCIVLTDLNCSQIFDDQIIFSINHFSQILRHVKIFWKKPKQKPINKNRGRKREGIFFLKKWIQIIQKLTFDSG